MKAFSETNILVEVFSHNPKNYTERTVLINIELKLSCSPQCVTLKKVNSK